MFALLTGALVALAACGSTGSTTIGTEPVVTQTEVSPTEPTQPDPAECSDVSPPTPLLVTSEGSLPLSTETFVQCTENDILSGHGWYSGDPPTIYAGAGPITLEISGAAEWSVGVKWTGGAAKKAGEETWELAAPVEGCHSLLVTVAGSGQNLSRFANLVRIGAGSDCTADDVTETSGPCPAEGPGVVIVVNGQDVPAIFLGSRLCSDGAEPVVIVPEEAPLPVIQVDPDTWATSAGVAMGVRPTTDGVGWGVAIDWEVGYSYETLDDGTRLLPTASYDACIPILVELSNGRAWVKYGAQVQVGDATC